MVMPRLCFPISDDLKERFEKMSEETQLTQSQLMNMALHSLIANYEVKGSFIFADLINPEHRESRKKR
jgi:predicted transcriptional regulator